MSTGKRTSSSADTLHMSRELLDALLARKAGMVDDPDATCSICPRCQGEGRLTALSEHEGRHQAISEEKCFVCEGLGSCSFVIAGAYERSLTPPGGSDGS